MKILVTAKRVTDPNARLVIDDDGAWIEDDVEYILNPFCEHAIECALQIAENHDDVETIAIGIGDEEAQRYIRQGALARGIDRGIHVEAEEQELDSDMIARILKAVVEKEEPDLVLLGKQAVDGDSNQVAQILAEILGWPQAAFASVVEIDGEEAVVTREVDGGLEVIAVELPAIISADLRLNDPRYASLAGIMKAKKKPLEEAAADLPATAMEIVSLELPPARPEGRIIGQGVDAVPALIEALRNEAKAI